MPLQAKAPIIIDAQKVSMSWLWDTHAYFANFVTRMHTYTALGWANDCFMQTPSSCGNDYRAQSAKRRDMRK
jgi:hypothetical protein